MSTPPDPQDPQDPREPGDATEPRGDADQDALWRSIVDNYGERHQLDDAVPEPPVTPPPPAHPEIRVPPSLRDLDGPRERVREDAEDHFVPPPPPALPRATPARTLAWLGLFGVPLLVLVAVVTRLTLPSWMGLLLMAWFVGGFVFLVASMRPGPSEDHDDGAVL